MQSRFLLPAIILLFLVIIPPMAADASDQFKSAGALYTKSVDLANEGKYQEAIQAADQALALNVRSLTPLIQANRAGILVVLGRYDEAVTAADAALSAQDNVTTTFSIAYYNKGDALRHLGRIEEAKVAFAKAHELDPSLVPPDMNGVTTVPVTVPVTSTMKTPIPVSFIISSIAASVIMAGTYWKRCR